MLTGGAATHVASKDSVVDGCASHAQLTFAFRAKMPRASALHLTSVAAQVRQLGERSNDIPSIAC